MSLETAISQRWANFRLLRRILSAASSSFALEYSEGDLGATLKKIRRRKTLAFARDWSYGRLLRWAAETYHDRPFVEFKDSRLSFQQLYEEASDWALRLKGLGIGRGDGVALMLSNHPDFLRVFFATQLMGAYAVPINTELRGSGLKYLLEHSQVKIILADYGALSERIAPLRSQLKDIGHYCVVGEGAERAASSEFDWLSGAPTIKAGNWPIREEDMPANSPSLLMYTSGTTGLPKAVTYTYGASNLKKLGFASRIFFLPEDKLYTCLPLFHANALMVSMTQALWMGLPVRIGRRFSASAFWQEVSESEATCFNALGAMIPILLKTPPSDFERKHKIRLVISSACPAEAWKEFETRFGVEIWEAYGAVDGGGVVVFNAGNAPVGSIGKPALGSRYRLVDAEGLDVAEGVAGELLFHTGKGKDGAVRYFKNEKASGDKVRDGWLHTGDLMRQDAKGFLYFVGRLTDSMRRRGENVSAYEVEKEIDSHPAILESAAFGVPSELGEDDIMVCAIIRPGQRLEPDTLRPYLSSRLPKYALPRYLRILEQMPKTATHRVIKAGLKEAAITDDTVDLETL
jgi:carnitine-CoA ligase